ncbi:unnamed protein product [Vicia faba]|uniref:Uncharacterized protein n=1 Tax=Vicia faba TaxID=3906 RepID=A0AAV1A3R4_VICFA|nr:unnamed protein product [Vicia faba]
MPIELLKSFLSSSVLILSQRCHYFPLSHLFEFDSSSIFQHFSIHPNLCSASPSSPQHSLFRSIFFDSNPCLNLFLYIFFYFPPLYTTTHCRSQRRSSPSRSTPLRSVRCSASLRLISSDLFHSHIVQTQQKKTKPNLETKLNQSNNISRNTYMRK